MAWPTLPSNNGGKPVKATAGATCDLDRIMFPDDTEDGIPILRTSSSDSIQMDRELTPVQNSEREAMESSHEISYAVVRQLFVPDNKEEDPDTVFNCTEYERQIFRHLYQLEVGENMHLHGSSDPKTTGGCC